MKTTGYDSVSSWGIAVACSFINCLAQLPMRVAGLLFVAFLHRYNTDRQTAALFVVISGALGSITSILIGYLGEIVQLRNLTIWGCLVGSLGVGICYFAENIITVTVSLGFLYGIGMSLQLTLLPQILKQHFTKNFASANGVINIGSCIGLLAAIPVVKLILDIYGVSGALLIVSGMMLNGVPTAMLLRDPKYGNNPISLSGKEANAKEVEQVVFNEQDSRTDSDHIEKPSTNQPFIMDNEKSVVGKDGVASDVYSVTEENKVSNTDQNTSNLNDQLTDGHTIENTPFLSSLQKDIDIHHKHEQVSNIGSKYGSVREHSPTIEKRNKYVKAFKTLAILRNPPFLVIMLCQSVCAYIVVVITTIVIDLSIDKGIPQSQAQFFLMMSPVAQTVGYTCLGWVTDKGYLTAARFLAVGSLCQGLSCCGYIFSNSFLTMMIAVVCFGLCVSIVMSVGPSLVYEYVEESKQSMAVAARFILYAPLCFTMGPTIRYFRGTLGSYDGVLYLLATFSAGATVLLLFLPCIARCTNRKR